MEQAVTSRALQIGLFARTGSIGKITATRISGLSEFACQLVNLTQYIACLIITLNDGIEASIVMLEAFEQSLPYRRLVGGIG